MIKIGLTDFTPASKIINIRDKNQVIKAQKAIDTADMLKCTLMGEHYIELSFELNVNALFKRSDYIEWEDEKYTLRGDYQPEQVSKQKYKYTLKFEAVEMLFQDVQYFYLHQGLKESEWRLIGNPEYFIKMAVDNVNRYFGVTDFTVGTIEPTETKDILFDTNTNTFNALTQIADEYGAEWYITGKTIHLLNKVSFGSEVDFEAEKSVASIKRNEGDTKTNYTRIVALGSTRNIPKDYRAATAGEGVDAIYPKRLRIPIAKGDVIDAYPNMSPDEVIEGTVIFDEIYPKRVGTIEAIGTIEYTDTDEETGIKTKWNAYKLKDSGINFKEEYVLPGEELRLVFESGELNGMDFALIFHDKGFSGSDNSQYFEIVRNEDYGKALPNDILKPKVGDKYVLYGFNIALVSDQYVPAAEQELYNTASEWLLDQLKDTGVYDCPTVIQHFQDNQMDLGIGQKVRLIKSLGRDRNYMGMLSTNYLPSAVTCEFLSNYYVKFKNTAIQAHTPYVFFNNIYLKDTGTYTLSFWAKKNNKEDITLRGGLRNSGSVDFSAVISNEWQYVTKQVKITTIGVVQLILYSYESQTLFYSIEVKDVKLEKGNKPTDWTPAPEDVDAIRSSRIMGFEKQLNNKYNATYTVGDNASYSRFASIEKDIKELQHAGIVYENTGGNSVYVIKQFDTTRPSDFNVYSAKASDAKYLNKQTGGTVESDVLFMRNIQTQGLNISDVFQNSTFTAGQLGSGFQIKRDANGQSYMEVDNLLVRREAVFSRLTIAEIKSVGGTILLSLASMIVSKVEGKTSTWKCYFNNESGTIPNDFAVGDMAICRKFTGANIKYYWALVTAKGVDYIELSKTDKDGSGVPDAGDEVVQLGNRSDVNRQHAIMLSAYGSDAPSIKQYSGINSYDLTGKEVTAISPKGNKFTGSFIVSTNGTTAPVYKERGVFVNGTTYYLNDRVSYLGSHWVCIVSSTITTPSETSVTWRKETAGQMDIDKAATAVRNEYKADFIVLDTKIASKVSQSTFDALGNRVSSAESSITQLSNSITSVVAKVDNIQIGGRNLLRNSTLLYSGGWYAEYMKQSNYSNYLRFDSLGNRADAHTYFWDYLSGSFTTQPLEVGQEYILSVDIRTNANQYRAGFRKDPASQQFYDFKNTPIKDTWFRHTQKAIINSSKWIALLWLVGINDVISTEFYIEVKNWKLEKGNKATDWTPAPEDVEAGIAAAQATADSKNRTYYQDAVPTVPSGGHKVGDLWYKTSLVDSSGNINADTSKNIYQLQYRWDGSTWRQINWSVSKSKIEQTDSSINLIVEKTGINSVGAGGTLYSMINQTAEQITLKVSKDGVISSINQSAESVRIQASKIQIDGTTSFASGYDPSEIQIGGRNYFKKSTTIGVYLGSRLVNRDNNGCTIVGSSGNLGVARFLNVVDSIGYYTVSGYIKGNLANSVIFEFNDIPSAVVNFTTEWTYFSRTIYVGRYSAALYHFMDIEKISYIYLYIKDLKIEKGNKPTDWTPAPEDTDYLTNALLQSTIITGGLISSSVITLGENGIDRAGINGLNTAESEVRIWAGTSFANRANAPFKVLQDGSFYASKAVVEGTITSNSSGNRITIDSNLREIRYEDTSNRKIGWWYYGDYGGQTWSSLRLSRFTNSTGVEEYAAYSPVEAGFIASNDSTKRAYYGINRMEINRSGGYGLTLNNAVAYSYLYLKLNGVKLTTNLASEEVGLVCVDGNGFLRLRRS